MPSDLDESSLARWLVKPKAVEALPELVALTVAFAEGADACRRVFLKTELPQARRWLSQVVGRSRLVRDLPEAVFQ